MKQYMKKVIVVGSGKLARTILDQYRNYSTGKVEKYSPNVMANEESVFVHVGSGREYSESLSLAIKFGASYIQAATEKDVDLSIPENLPISYIHAPNLDVNIIKLFYWVKLGKDLFKDEAKSIVESHQKEKTSKPGTAFRFCDFLNIDYSDIESIRDEKKQKALGIRKLDHHAYHRIEIGNENSMLAVETKIEGAISYVEGLSKIVATIPHLGKGVYQVENLVEKGLF